MFGKYLICIKKAHSQICLIEQNVWARRHNSSSFQCLANAVVRCDGIIHDAHEYVHQHPGNGGHDANVDGVPATERHRERHNDDDRRTSARCMAYSGVELSIFVLVVLFRYLTNLISFVYIISTDRVRTGQRTNRVWCWAHSSGAIYSPPFRWAC